MRMLRKVTSPKGTGKAATVDRPVWGKTPAPARNIATRSSPASRGVTWPSCGSVARPRAACAGITDGGLPAKTFGWLTATLEAGKPPVEIQCRTPMQVAASS
jgi:hypothetical protein